MFKKLMKSALVFLACTGMVTACDVVDDEFDGELSSDGSLEVDEAEVSSALKESLSFTDDYTSGAINQNLPDPRWIPGVPPLQGFYMPTFVTSDVFATFENGPITTVDISIVIDHAKREDLYFHVLSPDGTQYNIGKPPAGSGTYTFSKTNVATFAGKNMRGNWRLVGSDGVANGKTGTLKQWTITLRGSGSFERITVSGDSKGAAYASIADMDNDGRSELVISEFNTVFNNSIGQAGSMAIFHRDGGLETWSRQDVFTKDAKIWYPNQTTIADVDGDGDKDIVVPYGFLLCISNCGGIAWFERNGNTWVRHDLIRNTKLFYSSVQLADLDKDGIKDLISVGESMNLLTKAGEAHAQWFKGNTSTNRFESTPREMGEGLGSFPVVRDLDGDGDLDIASAEYFHQGGTFAWFEQVAAPVGSGAGTWTRRVIATDTGPAMQLSPVDNLFGDNVTRWIGTNHVNRADTPAGPKETMFRFDVPINPRNLWTKTVVSDVFASRPSNGAPQAAPGVFGYGDLNADGRIDLAVSGDGDYRLFWFEQLSDRTFAPHVLDANAGEGSGMKIADLDGNGSQEIVATSYDNNAVYIYVKK